MADITPISIGSPENGAPAPAGLDAATAKIFGTAAPPPEAQDPYANLDRAKLLERFKAAKEEGTDLRWVYERQWWRNLLYIVMRQWIYYDTKRGEWRDKRLQKWVPRPVTSKPRDVLVAIRAVFSAIKLGVIVRPNGRDQKNIITANTADELQPLIHDEHEMDRTMQASDFWLITCGNAFLKLWHDKDPKWGTQPATVDQCVKCGEQVTPDQMSSMTMPQCPQCGGTEFTQVPIQVPVGRGRTDVCSPFEVLLPAHASSFDEVRKIIRLRWRPKDYWEPKYKEFLDQNRISWEKSPSERSLSLYKALASQNDVGSTPFAAGGAMATTKGEGLTEYEYWEQPCEEYPEGLFFRVVGESSPVILEDPDEGSPGPLPERDKDDKPLWTWIHVPYEGFEGRVWAMGAIDPLIPLFDKLNRLDSRVELIIDRMANPIWLEPKGAEVEKFTGEPGLVVKYQVIGPSGARPERIPGEGPDASLFQIRQQIVAEIEEAAGTYDIIKGQKPTGVEAFSALQLLVERSQSRFTTAFNERGRAYRRWYSIALEMERSYGPDKRTLSLLGPNKTWTYAEFSKADLQGDVTVVVEDGTNVPKTSLGKRASVEQASQLGLIDPTDPDQKMGLYSVFGLQELAPALQSDVLSAHREQDEFEQWALDPANLAAYAQSLATLQGAQMAADADAAAGLPAPMMPPPPQSPLRRRELIDNDQIHFVENRKWANTDRVRELMRQNPTIELIITQHLAEHQMAIFATMAAQAGGMGAAPEPGPAGGNGGGGGQAMRNSNRESGSTADVPRGNGEGNQGRGPE